MDDLFALGFRLLRVGKKEPEDRDSFCSKIFSMYRVAFSVCLVGLNDKMTVRALPSESAALCVNTFTIFKKAVSR